MVASIGLPTAPTRLYLQAKAAIQLVPASRVTGPSMEDGSGKGSAITEYSTLGPALRDAVPWLVCSALYGMDT